MCNYLERDFKSLEDLLPRNLFDTLERSGICTPRQLLVLSHWDIKKVTNLSNEDICFVKTAASKNSSFNVMHCDQLLELENKNIKVITGCKVLDNALKGGFRKGTITEIYGESGAGKTQIGIQTAIHNWNEGCVYISTEDCFPVKRYEQIKNHLPKYCSSIDYGKNIYIEHITESQDLLTCVQVRLPKLFSKNKVSLIVIDSIAAPYRVESSNYIQRAEEIRELAFSLLKIAQEHNIAIVCFNQVTAAFNQSVDVLPSLGLAWSNLICTRLWLKQTPQIYDTSNLSSESNVEMSSSVSIREVSIEFSPELQHSVVKCIITSSGIIGITM